MLVPNVIYSFYEVGSKHEIETFNLNFKEEFNMPVVKVSLNDEYYQKLQEMAQEEKMSIQDYIRSKLFTEKSIFTPTEAVKRAITQYSSGDFFTLPEIYGDDWKTERGVAGVFGKRFFNYVSDGGTDKIEFARMVDYGRHAQYKMI